MNDENFEINEELQQLREDYSALKKDLEREKIINEDLMDSAFKRNVSIIMLDKKLSLVVGAIVAVFLPTYGFLYSLPFKYVAILEIFCLAYVVANIVFYKKYDMKKITVSDVLTASKTMKDFKKSYRYVSIAVWIAFFALAAYFIPIIIDSWSTPLKATCAIVIFAIFIIIALFVDYRYSKKIIASCDSIINCLDGFNE